jgi:hypothetical protein
MAMHRTRKNKENPHYNFVYSWSPTKRVYDPAEQPSEPHVKGESALPKKAVKADQGYAKRANLLAKDGGTHRIKKNIIKSLVLVSFILILEVVVYLALHR